MAKRSFAGYACEESISVGLFGECFRAQKKNGQEARVLVVDERLSQRKRFATALARHGGKLSDLVHPHIVTTQAVGKGKDGSLVVIASAVDEAVELRAIIERAHGRLPQDIALSIAMGALRGLSYAHEHGVTHGGVHPRSVLVNGRGVSMLADFGVAHALASAAAAAEDSELLAGLRGYVAPELALGQAPDVTSDVYAAGALVSQLLWNQPAPPEHEASALAHTLRGAIDTDSTRRFGRAGEFENALRQAIDESKLDVAGASKVVAYLHEVGEQLDAGLDEETEGLLASLGLGGARASAAPRSSTALEDALAGLSDDLLGLEDSVDDIDPADITVAEYADDYEDDLTSVDPEHKPAAVDPLEAIISEDTAQPELLAELAAGLPENPGRRSRSRLTPAADYDHVDETPLPAPRPFHEDGTHVAALVDLVGQQAASSAPFEESQQLPIETRSNTARWLALIAFVMAALVAVAYTQTGIFKAAQSESEARHTEALEKIEAAQPVPGEVVIASQTEEAAVWLLLGRTPARSFPLPSSMVHELRLEHEGFRSLFLSVAAQHWSGQEQSRKATLSASMVLEGDQSHPLPAFPPIADPPPTAGGKGQGVVEVETQPVGAEVWLLIGTTPETRLRGIEAGKNYQFKVLKDGHRPALAAVKAEDWYLTGSDGPMRPSLTRTVVLEPLPGAGDGAVDGDGAAAPAKEHPEKRPKRRRRRKKSK